MDRIKCNRNRIFFIFEVGKPIETESYDIETGDVVSNEREDEFIITRIDLNETNLKVKFDNNRVKCFPLCSFLNVNYIEK